MISDSERVRDKASTSWCTRYVLYLMIICSRYGCRSIDQRSSRLFVTLKLRIYSNAEWSVTISNVELSRYGGSFLNAQMIAKL
jgi:hypothetical protein